MNTSNNNPDEEVCAKCKREGHNSDICFARKNKEGELIVNSCKKCQRKGHTTSNCHYMTDIYGYDI